MAPAGVRPLGGATAATVVAGPAKEQGGLRRRLVRTDAAAVLVAWLPEVWLAPRAAGTVERAVVVAVALVATIVTMQAAGLYRARVCASRSSEAVRVVGSAAVGVVAVAAGSWFFGGARSMLPLADGTLTAALVLVLRWRFGRWLRAKRSTGRFMRTVVLIGTNGDAASLWDLLEAEPELGYRVGAVLGPDRGNPRWQGVPTSADVRELSSMAERVGANGVLLVGSALDGAATQAALAAALGGGLHVQVWPGLAGLASWRLRLSPVSTIPLLYVEPHRTPPWQVAVKRGVDVTVASLALVAAAPVLALAALLIKREDGGPVLYRGRRVGWGGQPINVLKLRTMVPDAAARRAQVAALNERTGGPLFKASADPRVTRIGRLLRATSIDELPQLWNVLNGSMSLVGPRPAESAEVEQFDQDLRDRRHAMRPGITGLWQIEARNNPSFNAYRRLDLAYVDNWSLRLDAVILAATIHALVAEGMAFLGSLRSRG